MILFYIIETITLDQVVTKDSAGSLSSDMEYPPNRTSIFPSPNSEIPPPPPEYPPSLFPQSSGYSRSRPKHAPSISPLSSPNHRQYLARPPGLGHQDHSPPRHHTYQQAIPLMSSGLDLPFTPPPGMSEERMPGESLYYTDRLQEYDPYYMSNRGMYGSEMEYGGSLNRSDMTYDPRLYPQEMEVYPSNVLNQSDRGTSYESLYYTDRGGYYDSLYHTDRDPHYNSLYHTDRGTYDSLYHTDRGTHYDSLYHTDRDPHHNSLYQTDMTRYPYPSHGSIYCSEGSVPMKLTYPSVESNLDLVKPMFDEKHLEKIMEVRKQGDLDKALYLLLQLKEETSPTLAVYLEIIRIYSDQGEYFKAEEMIEEGLQMFAKDEQLLEKWIRVEERIGNVKKILKAIDLLLENHTYRIVKSVVETCMNLCKLNNSYNAYIIFEFILNRGLCKQGNLLVHYALFLYRSIATSQAVDFLKTSLQQYPKHGPMWFDLFHFLEQQLIIHWDCRSVAQRVVCTELLQYYEEAVKAVSNELRWKVYYMATQMVLRTITHLRIVLHTNVLLMVFCNF